MSMHSPPLASPITTPQHEHDTAGRLVFGVLVMLAGAALLVDTAGWWAVPWETLPGLALLGVGGALLLGVGGRHQGGLVGLGVVLTIVAAVTAALGLPFSGDIGDRIARPTSAATLESPYRLAVGSQRLDLSSFAAPVGVTTIVASAGVGRLEVVLPRDVTAQIEAHTGLGAIALPERREDGVNVAITTRVAADRDANRVIVLQLEVGVGEIEVRR